MENSQIMLTGKLFEYLATENPILCIGDRKADAAFIVDQLGNSKSFTVNELPEINEFIFLNYKKEGVNKASLLNTNKFSRYETTRELSELIKSIV